MAITGNPGDLATGGFGTGVRGVAATPRDVANAVTRGREMAAAREVGQGSNRNAGTGFRGPQSTWGTAPSVVSQAVPKLSYNPYTSPRFWGREEENMLSRSGMLHYINQDPNSRLGYQIHQNPDGSGLILGGQPPAGLLGSFNIPNIQKIRDQGIDPKLYPGLLDVTPNTSADMYQGALKHELGHAGQFVKQGYQADETTAGLEMEELRQRLADIATLPSGHPVRNMAEIYVDNYRRTNSPPPVAGTVQIPSAVSSGRTSRQMPYPSNRNPFFK